MSTDGDDPVLRHLMKRISVVRRSFGNADGKIRAYLAHNPDRLAERERGWNQQAWRLWRTSGGQWGWPPTEFRASLYR
ncbi:MAG TPA: hypothetical protein DHW20_01770 [Gemmatimonadetes bacterium]|nr:hypothetical protein [Gemmatimonadota bacterium]|tara:strand:+ start:15308 stop:15541 length:234 start_codon:yes stop_codon:yes gene_type:complete